MRSKSLIIALVLLLSVVGHGQQNAAPAPDAVYFNGKVVTVDSGFSVQQAFALRGETFAAVGTNERMRALAGSATRLIDLKGATVIPGLTDNHNHLYDTARLFLTGVNMDGVASSSDVLDRIRTAVAAHQGPVVFTSVVRLPAGQAFPTKADLDRISATVPIVMLRGRRGGATYNTAALAMAGVTKEHPTFGGTAMPKDASGELTGASPAYPASMPLLDRLLPPLTDAEEDAFLLKAIAQRHELGLTSVRDLSVFPYAMRAYFRLWQKGQLTMRVGAALDVPVADPDRFEEALRGWGMGSGFGDAWLRLDTISEDPYPPVVNAQQFTAMTMIANRYGWRFAPHLGVNDGGLDIALDAYEAADRQSSIKNKRWILEHAPDATPAQMDRMAKLGIVVSASISLYGGLNPTLEGAARAAAERQTPMREFLDHGLVVSSGTDFLTGVAPNDSPFTAFYFYTTRKTRTGQVVGAHEKITRAEALKVGTLNYAYSTFEEKIKGSIEAGKLADFLILSDDILTVPDEKLLSLHPLATYVGGRKVFAAPGSGF